MKQYMVQADLKYSLEEHISKSLVFSFIAAILLTLLAFLLVIKQVNIFLLLAFVVFFFGAFYMSISYPYVLAQRRMRDIDSELLFAGKHLLILLRSGVPLFEAMSSFSTGYGELSKEMRKIVDLVTVGVPFHEAMKKVAEQTPSRSLRRLLMQLVNSLLFGSEVTTACEAIVNEIAKEMEIEVREYGQKLNPIVISFLVIGIISPSIVIAFVIIISSLFSAVVSIEEIALFSSLLIIALIHFVFFSLITAQRPKVL